MSNLFKQKYTKVDPNTGKRVTRRSKKWYGKYRDADGVAQRKPLCSDKAAAQAMLNELVRAAERQEAGLSDIYDKHRRRPLLEHLDEFADFLTAKENSAKHVRQMKNRIKKVFGVPQHLWARF